MSADEVLSTLQRLEAELHQEETRRDASRMAVLTYVSAHQGKSGRLHRHTLRSSLWVRTSEGWQVRFHQGTPMNEDEPGAT